MKLLVGTTTSETWVVGEDGCNDLASSCPNDRGYLFNATNSTTWQQNNVYDISAENNLGIDISGQYGFDTVGLGWQGSGGPLVNHSVVAAIAAPEIFLGEHSSISQVIPLSSASRRIGVFGLSFRPVNFSNFDNPQPSYMSLLRESNMIPSRSYGYTAGAKNRQRKSPMFVVHDLLTLCLGLQGVLGSLILGGYDASLFEPNNVSFDMNQVTYRDLVVGVKSISVQATGEPNRTYSRGFYSFVDSIAPHIWLPLAACQMFEKAFGITYDPSTDLYPVNDTWHSHLLSQNASVSFELSMDVDSGPAVTVTLPYSSFDLLATAEYPSLDNETRYFPIRRAANESQFTLGRTFLQDAYLIVDYERSNFSVFQRVFDPNQKQSLVAIEPPTSAEANNTKIPSAAAGSMGGPILSIGAIAGISTAAVAALLFALGFWWLIKKRMKRNQTDGRDEETEKTIIWHGKPELEEQLRYELEVQKPEMDGQPRYELEQERPEMEGGECTGTDPYHRPAELPSELSACGSGQLRLHELE